MGKKQKLFMIPSVAILLIVGITVGAIWVTRDGAPGVPNEGGKQGQQVVEPPPAEEIPSKKLNAGDTVMVSVLATDITDMYGYQLCVNYDKDTVKYSGELKSNIAEISTIFRKEFDGYVLVGATKIGDKPGSYGSDVNICSMVFTVIQDCEWSDISISSIDVVTSSGEYIKGINNWDCELKIGNA